MSELDVRIVEMEAQPVVAALGFGTAPELEAWRLIEAFARDHGLDLWSGRHRFFGFNNPDPSPGSPNYGYEQWMTVDATTFADPPYEIKATLPGRYAVTRLRGAEHIAPTWHGLVAWFEEHGHPLPSRRELCLEELLTPIGEPTETWEFDLYLGLDG